MRSIANHGLRFDVVEITPDDALNLLTANTMNRPQVASAQVRYADDMRDGNWVLNGEPIIVSRTGRLLNGQNRLQSCVEANAPFISAIITGVADAAFETMDDGAKRTLGNALHIHQEENTNALAATLVLLWQMERQCLGETAQPSKKQAMDVLARHPSIRGSVSKAGAVKHLMPTAIMALVHYVGAELLSVPEKANRFLEDVASGVGLAPESPARVFREKMIFNRAARQRLLRKAIIAFSVIAWNKTYEGKGLKILKAPVAEGREKIIIPPFTGLPRADEGRRAA